MLRVPMIRLLIFLLRTFLMFAIQLNSSLELVLLFSFGTSVCDNYIKETEEIVRKKCYAKN